MMYKCIVNHTCRIKILYNGKIVIVVVVADSVDVNIKNSKNIKKKKIKQFIIK